jgi:YfiH family protein
MYQIPALKNIPGLFHVFSTTDDGNMSFIWGENDEVMNNRRKFIDKIHLGVNDIVAMQVEHKDKLTEVGRSEAGRGIDRNAESIITEGLITKEKGLYLFLMIADCLPVIVFDKDKKILALVHAGWKSVEREVLTKIIQRFTNNYHSDPSNIIVGIGPSIKEASYKFAPDAALKESNVQLWDMNKWQSYYRKWDNGKVSIDIVGYGKQQLLEQGVQPNNIFISDIDTAADANYFSHYRDISRGKKREGRFACIAGMI